MSTENTQKIPERNPTPFFDRFIESANKISVSIVNGTALPMVIAVALVVGATIAYHKHDQYIKYDQPQQSVNVIAPDEGNVRANELIALTRITDEFSDIMRDVRSPLGKQLSSSNEGYMRQMVDAYGLDTTLKDDTINAVNDLYEFKTEFKKIAIEMLDNMKHPDASVKENLDKRHAALSSKYDAFRESDGFKSVTDLVATIYISSKFAEAMEASDIDIRYVSNKEQPDDVFSNNFGDAVESTINLVVENKYPNVSKSMQDAFDRVVYKIHDAAIDRVVREHHQE